VDGDNDGGSGGDGNGNGGSGAVTTINSKEAAMAAAEELDDGQDGRRLCSVFFVIPISSHHHRH
jgi:hypothetical protein